MPMKYAWKLGFLATAVLLHAGLMVLAYNGLNEPKALRMPPSLTVSVVQTPEKLSENALIADNTPEAAPPRPPEPRPAPPKPKKTAPPAKPASRPRPSVEPLPSTETSNAATPAPAPSEPAGSTAQPAAQAPASPAPTAPAAPAALATAPARTEVGISASYAAANRRPEYPATSQRYGEQGTVRLRIFVLEDGTAGKIELKASSGFPLLDKAAINAAREWRFNPATLDGKPIAEWYQVSIPFKLEK